MEGGRVESRIGSRLTGDDGLVGVLRVHEVGCFGVRWAVWRRVGWDAAGRAVASSGAGVRRVEGVGAVRVERRVQGCGCCRCRMRDGDVWMLSVSFKRAGGEGC